MSRWRERLHCQLERVAVPVKVLTPVSGQCHAFYAYLEGRYADRVVLTFGQIEDLLGVALPDLARRDETWWTMPDETGSSPRFSDAWILAHRTARPNFVASTVVFDRVA